MNNTIVFRRTPHGVTIEVDGERVGLEPSLRYRRHSPTGFEFGYAGSGPAQSALAILLHVLGFRNADENWKGGDAERVYQAFKFEHITPLEHQAQEATIECDVESWAKHALYARGTRP
jgi:hypothetical protein